jgi:bifunctional enzyme CysN/CysC
MVTGASNAHLALILIDAEKGVVTQSRRHGFLVSLLRIPHLIVAVNKMDLAGYGKDAFDRIRADYDRFSEKLDIQDITYIPVSALNGDNVVSRSANMPWYQGFPLLKYLETVHVTADHNQIDFRFPVQYVVRPHYSFRGYAGRIASGSVAAGEELAVLPSGRTTRLKSIVTFDGDLGEASAGQSVVLTLDDEIDISRGDMLVRRNNLPQLDSRFEAIVCWMSDTKLATGRQLILKHTTRIVKAFVSRIFYRIDINTLHREKVSSLELNDIARVEITTAQPLMFDAYAVNRVTGSFILIEPDTNMTVAGGMIRGPARDIEQVTRSASADQASRRRSSNITWQKVPVAREERELRQGHKAMVLWFTGYSGAGKSTIARMVEKKLFVSGASTILLDGDNLRHGLCGDLGFSDRDRTENIRRAGEVAKLFFDNGSIVLCTFISPFRSDRAFARSIIEAGRFLEVHVKCSLDVCKRRDPRGLYAKAASGGISRFTGIDSPYEEPENAEIVVETDIQGAEDIVETIMTRLKDEGILSQ